jgi:DNA polymerase V
MLTELTPEGDGQADLFDARDTPRRRRLMAALDALNRRLGRDTVFYAGSGLRRD